MLDDSTNLARALDVIAARAGRIAGAVIWTDGRFTDAGWPAAADSLAAAGVEVVIVPMESPPSDARLAGLTVQRRGQTVQLGVTVAATGTEKRQLKLWRQDLKAGGVTSALMALDILSKWCITASNMVSCRHTLKDLRS